MKHRKKPGKTGNAWFTTTSWSSIDAIQKGAPNAPEALERLCQTYRYPLYAYVRQTGRSPEDAEDLTQAFFYHILQKNYFQVADRSRGRFRSLLLTSLKYFLHNDYEFHQAQVRGGGKTILSLDEQTAEGRYLQEPAVDLTPDKIYERNWAATVQQQVCQQLRQKYQADGKLALFEQIQVFLTRETAQGEYESLAPRIGMKPNTLAVAVKRLRQRYGELLRAEIARTVVSSDDLEAELRHFFAILQG